ncbi:multiple epidermal growth factor-like domains protein 10 isoform X2 [Haliotis rubra]|uniref:multiple epidermal growth factor-like domains protein 10 isoform X2 n=1 Tax=Haliotis rubra TaxID=36100 RepID=UPI001EE5E6E9|nr:multiple epidermal growth factor-like domains protein 10 isoform X2 [Haliotis rubra]
MAFWNLLNAIIIGQLCVFNVGGSEYNCLSLSSSLTCGECYIGWYGDYCDKACDCNPGGCNKVTGVCIQCQAGYYSTNCSQTCPPQCRESYDDRVFCGRTTGNCLEGCKQTWWGDKCEHKCGKQCNDSICFFYDGSCASGCVHGLTGTHCNKSCSAGCLGGNCRQLNGVCPRGCKTGFYGRTCDRRCTDKCQHKDCYTRIDRDRPTCTRGCIPRWKPPFCDIPCPPYCLSCTEAGVCTSCKKGFTGSRCEKRCNCRSSCSDDKLCDGCSDGWRGQTCELPCSKNCLICQQESGNCTACRQGFAYDGRSQCTPIIQVTTDEVPIPGQDSKVPVLIILIIVPLIIVAAVCILIYIRRRMSHQVSIRDPVTMPRNLEEQQELQIHSMCLAVQKSDSKSATSAQTSKSIQTTTCIASKQFRPESIEAKETSKSHPRQKTPTCHEQRL